MAEARAVFGDLRPRDLVEIHGDRLGSGNRFFGLCTVSRRLAFTMEGGTGRLADHHGDLGVECYRMALVLGSKRRWSSRLRTMDGRFSISVLYERYRHFRLAEQRLFHFCSGAAVDRLCHSAHTRYASGDYDFRIARDRMHRRSAVYVDRHC